MDVGNGGIAVFKGVKLNSFYSERAVLLFLLDHNHQRFLVLDNHLRVQILHARLTVEILNLKGLEMYYLVHLVHLLDRELALDNLSLELVLLLSRELALDNLNHLYLPYLLDDLSLELVLG